MLRLPQEKITFGLFLRQGAVVGGPDAALRNRFPLNENRIRKHIPVMKHKLFATLSAVAFASTASLQAQLIAEEEFDYATGQPDPTTLNGGSGWSGAWGENASSRPDPLIESPSLAYSDGTNSLLTSGNRMRGFENSTGGATDVERDLSSAVSTDFWVSALINKEQTNAGMRFLLKDSAGGNFLWVELGSTINIADNITGGGDTAVASPSANADYFVVMRYDRVSGTNNDTFDLWVNPDLDASGTSQLDSTALGTASITMSSGEFGNLAQVRYQGGSDAAGAQNGTQTNLDEIRIGGSYGDVSPIPEPGTYVLLAGCTGLLFVMLRRRRG